MATGAAVIDRAAEILQDTSKTTYTATQLLDWTNDAQRAVCLVRPDANSVTESITLTAGSKQTLPSGRRRLMALVRNMGANGTTPGRAIRGPVPREDLDAANPNWHTETGSAVKEYVYDENTPDVFYVHPYVNSTWNVEAVLAANPADLTAATDSLALDDAYIPAMIEWVLYRCFARDDETTPNWTRAGRHFVAFFNLLQVKLRADMAISPKVIEYDQQLQVQR